MDTQTFIGNAEALIEILNDLLNDAFRDEIFEENESPSGSDSARSPKQSDCLTVAREHTLLHSPSIGLCSNVCLMP